MTIVMVNLGQFLISPWAILGYFALLLMALYALARYVGLVRWEPPLVRHFSRDLDAAIVLRAAAGSRRAAATVPGNCLSGLALPTATRARRLRRANDMVTSGANWCDSLQKVGLVGPVEVAVLKAAEKIDNLGWALGEMADRQVRSLHGSHGDPEHVWLSHCDRAHCRRGVSRGAGILHAAG